MSKKDNIKIMQLEAQREELKSENRKLQKQLRDIRDTLKPYMVAYSEWASQPEAAIRTVLAKHFSVAIPE